MKLTICLAKKVLIFYSLLAPVIIFASLYNLIEGVIMGHTSNVRLGPFSLFGFTLLPLLIIITYRKNKCVIQPDRVSIGKTDYKSSDYNFYIKEKHISLKDRPIFSLFTKRYYVLLITQKDNNNPVLEEDMSVFQSDIKKMKFAFLNNYGQAE